MARRRLWWHTLRFKTTEPRPVFTDYAERLGQRPALKRADARNAAAIGEGGIGR